MIKIDFTKTHFTRNPEAFEGIEDYGIVQATAVTEFLAFHTLLHLLDETRSLVKAVI